MSSISIPIYMYAYLHMIKSGLINWEEHATTYTKYCTTFCMSCVTNSCTICGCWTNFISSGSALCVGIMLFMAR